MKKLIVTIVSAVMTVNMIVSSGVNAQAEAVYYYKTNNIASVVRILNDIYYDNATRCVNLDIDDETSIYFEYRYESDMSRYTFSTCNVRNGRFVERPYTESYYTWWWALN